MIIEVGGRDPQLFNLTEDPFEKSNLAEDHPKVVERLHKALMEEAAKDDDAIPKRE